MSHEYCTENALHDGIVPDAELCAAVPDLNNDGIIDGGKDACQDWFLNFGYANLTVPRREYTNPY